MSRRHRRPAIGVLAASCLLFLTGCGERPAAPPEAEPLAPPADAGELVVRSRDVLRQQLRAFDVVQLTGDEIVRTGRVVTYPASDKPVIDLTWDTDGELTRVRSDGTTVTVESASGEVLVSPWSEAGSALYGREVGKLLAAALDATSFANYGARLEPDPERGILRAVAPLPGGGAWTVAIADDTWLPVAAGFQATADGPVERVTLEETSRIDAVPAAELAPSAEVAAAATRFYAGPAPGDPAPEVEFELVDGTKVLVSELRGRVVVLDFWATWCAPCRPAMRKLEELYQEHRDEGLEVYGLRLFDAGDATDYLAGLGVTYSIGDGAPFAEPYAVSTYGLPTLYVLDRKGRVVTLVVGFSADGEAALLAAVESALAG